MKAAGSDAGTEIKPFIGIHPWFTDSEDRAESKLVNEVKKNSLWGIGECGLDFSPGFKNNRELQIRIFETQLDLSRQYARPLVIHCVKAWEQLFISLKRLMPLSAPFMLHSFYGTSEIIRRLVNLGAYISLSTVSLLNPEKSSKAIISIPDNRLLIETDMTAGSPDFTKSRHLRSLQNNYMSISEIRSIPMNELKSMVWTNGTIFTN
jgi:TatD DNase family protein